MARLLRLVIWTALVGIIVWITAGDIPILAQAGCCKVRESFTAPWQKNGMPFEQCRKLNQERDRDNVFEPLGLVWWDTRC